MKKIVQLFMLSACVLTYQVQAKPVNSKNKTSSTKIADKLSDSNEAEPNIADSKGFEYKCELGNSLTIYAHPEDAQNVALRWKKRLYKMNRIETSTGADRYENPKNGFVFIGIPAKGLLLDSHKGQQLANECKTETTVLAENTTAKTETKAETKAAEVTQTATQTVDQTATQTATAKE